MTKSGSFPANTASTGFAEVRRRLWYVLLGLIIFRIGAHVPVPGLDPKRLQALFSHQTNTILGMFNMFSGGALSKLTVFALSVMPYISASIIIQLLTAVSPKLDQLRKEGESGRRKINQYTRYGTLFLAFFQALGIAKWLASEGIAIDPGLTFYFTATITLVTGTMFLMWLGEQMTERGIGNGISLIITAGIVSGLPAAIARTLQQVREGQLSVIALLLIAALIVVVTGFVVFMESGQRRITVNYAKRQQGRKMYAAQSSHLPFKINMSGVIPPIFASSLILLPGTLASFLGNIKGFEWLASVALWLSPTQPLYMICYGIMIIFFAFFYTALVFNPKETAENLKKSGAFIPGIRPGEQTANYIDKVMSRLTLVGALYLALVALMPEFMIVAWHVPFFFGGTSLLIIVVVLMDFMAQMRALMMSYQYESLMKKSNLRGAGPSGMFR
ncbi:MAG: preprotein translocase subunit SecY [Legionellales bacterium]|nr:preprotein translocase subunit SecY [Legionellales bacterium]